MRFGKRRKDSDSPAADTVTVATPATPTHTATESWTVPDTGAGGSHPPTQEHAQTYAQTYAPAYEPASAPPAYEPPAPAYEPAPAPSYEPAAAAADFPPYAPPEGVVEGEAVEIPAAEPDPPVVVTASGAEPARAAPLGAAAETFASGQGPATGPAWPEGVQELVAERPEILVGAAFVGGIVAAMIIRRLGN